MTFLATAAGGSIPTLGAGAGFSFWQTVGGLAVVFGLLVLCLRLLGRLHGRKGQGDSAVLAVWNLGPRREIQVLRLAEEVHYIYRHDGAMVLLRQETLAEWEASRPGRGEAETPPGGLLKNLFQARILPLRGPSASVGMD